MSDNYYNFISQVPDNIMRNTKVQLYNNTALFKPHYICGKTKIDVTDYHVVVLADSVPDTYFNNKVIRIGQRKILTVNPGDKVYCSRKFSTKPYYSLLIKPRLLGKIAEEMDFYDEIRFSELQNPFSGNLFWTMKNFEQEYERKDRLPLLLDSLEIQIASLLLREFKTNIKSRDLCPDGESYVRLAAEYMQAYFSSNITIEDICREIHVSPYHFIRMFKQQTGMSPHQYLLDVRIKKAKELLTSGAYTVAETATLCGFLSASHFSATFKKYAGCSPLDYKTSKKPVLYQNIDV